jgi:hypothetical protein
LFAFWKVILSFTCNLRMCAVSDDSRYRAMTCFYPFSPVHRIAFSFNRSMMLAVFLFAVLWLYTGLDLVHDAARGNLSDLSSYCFNSLTLFPNFAWICFSKTPTMNDSVAFPPLQEPASTC